MIITFIILQNKVLEGLKSWNYGLGISNYYFLHNIKFPSFVHKMLGLGISAQHSGCIEFEISKTAYLNREESTIIHVRRWLLIK